MAPEEPSVICPSRHGVHGGLPVELYVFTGHNVGKHVVEPVIFLVSVFEGHDVHGNKPVVEYVFTGQAVGEGAGDVVGEGAGDVVGEEAGDFGEGAGDPLTIM